MRKGERYREIEREEARERELGKWEEKHIDPTVQRWSHCIG